MLILDGWGIAPDSEANPISQVKLPNYEIIQKKGKAAKLWAHGEYVGLMKDQDGNSEAGHLNLGAGRIVKQDGVVVSEAIKNGTFSKNPAFYEAVNHAKRNKSAVHLIGLLSDGQSAHATPEHVYALLDFLDEQKMRQVFVHIFTDGRDSAPTAGRELAQELSNKLHANQQIGTVMGRFYGMDRNKQWKRTQMAYEALVDDMGVHIDSVDSVFEDAYNKNISDEFIAPHIICRNGAPLPRINEHDSIIFFNHRSDRARQLTKAFVQDDFENLNPNSFKRTKNLFDLRFVAMTDFGPDLEDVLTAFPSTDVTNSLPRILSKKRQIYIAETEKYAHMTYFFNGGYADPVGGEERVMVPSPHVDHYSETPRMSSEGVTEQVLTSVLSGQYDFVAANYACPDMMGHTDSMQAAREALVAVDGALGKILEAVRERHGMLMLTADHGNIEEMKNLTTGEPDTEHSKNQVPFIVWCDTCEIPDIRENGILADVAPTILSVFGIQKPKEMTGKNLFISDVERVI